MKYKPGSRFTVPLVMAIAMQYLEELIENIGDYDEFTWSPKTRMIYIFKIKKHLLDLFWELVEGSRNLRPDAPIYLIAVTNNTDISVNATLKRAYQMLATITNQPLFGSWIDKYGTRYLDAVLPTQVLSIDEAVRIAKEYEQDYIVRIDPDGGHESIKVE